MRDIANICFMLKKVFFNSSIIFIVFFLDRLSKVTILSLTNPLGELNISFLSFINLQLVWNDGIAFGLLSMQNKLYYNLITILIGLITLIIIWLGFKSKGLEKICFLIIAGGSLGNMFDRIFYSAVPDFIDISINNFHWFIFNVADIFISIGVILLLTLEFFKKHHE